MREDDPVWQRWTQTELVNRHVLASRCDRSLWAISRRLRRWLREGVIVIYGTGGPKGTLYRKVSDHA